MSERPRFEPPDTIAALPRPAVRVQRGRPSARPTRSSAQPPEALFRRLIGDQESETVLLVARRVLDAFLARMPSRRPSWPPMPARTRSPRTSARVRAELAADDRVAGPAHRTADARDAVLRQRAVLGLLGGCWLDVLSQPATQPSVIVNRLFAQHFTLRGEGNPRRSLHCQRRQQLEQTGVFLPEIAAADFLAAADARPLTALHGCFYLALSRLPANFLPELVGVHYAVLALGVDDLLSGLPPMIGEPELREVLAAYLELAGPGRAGPAARRPAAARSSSSASTSRC